MGVAGCYCAPGIYEIGSEENRVLLRLVSIHPVLG
jgi:hypothetical protein